MEIELNPLIDHFAQASFRVLGVYHQRIEPGKAGWQRSAPCAGFIFPLSGKARFHFNGTPYTICTGNVVHGGADMSMDKRVLGNLPWEYISVLYQVLPPEPEGLKLYDSHFQLTIGHSPRLAELLWRLWQAANQPGPFPAFQTEMLFRCVLEEVFVCCGNQTSDETKALFEQAAAYIRQHYMEGLTVRGLAEQSGVNENRLFYVFSKHAGMGAGDYLKVYRLNRAKELLITGAAPVGEVARGVGYVDALHFSRSFKRHFGVSPSEFRKTFRNNL